MAQGSVPVELSMHCRMVVHRLMVEGSAVLGVYEQVISLFLSLSDDAVRTLCRRFQKQQGLRTRTHDEHNGRRAGETW